MHGDSADSRMAWAMPCLVAGMGLRPVDTAPILPGERRCGHSYRVWRHRLWLIKALQYSPDTTVSSLALFYTVDFPWLGGRTSGRRPLIIHSQDFLPPERIDPEWSDHALARFDSVGIASPPDRLPS
jgi:hypothetical protein